MSMSTGPSYHSDEELLKRLHALLAERPLRPGDRRALAEVRNLFGELASRIHDDGGRWGLSTIPAEFRDDAAQDALVDLLAAIGTVKDARSATEWFGAAAEERFRQLWSEREHARALERRARAASNGTAPPPGPADISEVFDAAGGPWARFEREFPRDASALRLRYEQDRTPDELEAMLDAPSVHAVKTRLSRARSRFRMFVEQAGYDRRAVASILERFDEGTER